MSTVAQKIAQSGLSPVGVEPRVYHSGQAAPMTTTTGTDTTPVVTEQYLCAVLVEANTTLTGVALLNGSAVAGNVTVALYDSAGALLASSASTAQAGTAAYQQIPFAAAVAVKGPGRYFVMASFDNVAARFRSHILGNFPAGKLTAQVYGTLAAVTVPTTFTTGLGPIADTY